MASVITEHVILLVPTFFAIMIFSLVANTVVANYAMQQRAIVIEGAQNQFITTISQIYFSVNQPEIQSCVVTKVITLPEQIDGQIYVVTGNLDGNLLTLTFDFPGISQSDEALIHLGPEAQWDSSSFFTSTKTNSVIIFDKYYNATVGDFRIKLSLR